MRSHQKKRLRPPHRGRVGLTGRRDIPGPGSTPKGREETLVETDMSTPTFGPEVRRVERKTSRTPKEPAWVVDGRVTSRKSLGLVADQRKDTGRVHTVPGRPDLPTPPVVTRTETQSETVGSPERSPVKLWCGLID